MKLMRFFRIPIPNDATTLPLATTLFLPKAHLITPLTLRVSVWNEKPSSRESARRSTGKPSRKNKRNSLRSGKNKSNSGGSRSKRNTSGSSRGESSKKCGSRWRTIAITPGKTDPVLRSKVLKWGCRKGRNRLNSKKSWMKRGKRGTKSSTSMSIWPDRNNRMKSNKQMNNKVKPKKSGKRKNNHSRKL